MAGQIHPVYKVKNIQKDQIWENSIDARTGSSSACGKHALSVKDLEAQDRRNLLALRAVRQKLSDAVVVAERSTRGKAISGGLIDEDGILYFVVVVDTADGLKQVLLEPPRRSRPMTAAPDRSLRTRHQSLLNVGTTRLQTPHAPRRQFEVLRPLELYAGEAGRHEEVERFCASSLLSRKRSKSTPALRYNATEEAA